MPFFSDFPKKSKRSFSDFNKAAYEDKVDIVRECIEQFTIEGRLKQLLNETGATRPLLSAISRERYEAGILLLEAGSLPMHCEDDGFSPFIATICFSTISFSKLLLLFDPDYSKLMRWEGKTPEDILQNYDSRYPGKKKAITEAAQDSKNVRKWFANAHYFRDAGQADAAAFNYLQAANIFMKHTQFEKEQTARELVLVDYYGHKIKACLQLYHDLDRNYHFLDKLSAEQKLAHQDLLAPLKDLDKALAHNTEPVPYAGLIQMLLTPTITPLSEVAATIVNPMYRSAPSDDCPFLSHEMQRAEPDLDNPCLKSVLWR